MYPLKSLFIVICIFSVISCTFKSPAGPVSVVEPDHLVSRAAAPSHISIDGTDDEWSKSLTPFGLAEENGEASAVFFKVEHDPNAKALYLLLVSPGPFQKVDVYIDVSGDAIMARPVQYTFGEKLNAAQSQQLDAASVVQSISDERNVQEWQFDLAKLGLSLGFDSPIELGFDIEVVMTSGEKLHWGDRENKWLNDRLLRRLTLVAAGTKFSRIKGNTLWEAPVDESPPSRVSISRVGDPEHSFQVMADPKSGAFQTTVPEGEYVFLALDSRTVPSLAKPCKVSVDGGKVIDKLMLTVKRPIDVPLDGLIAETMSVENIKALGVAYVKNGDLVYNKVFGSLAIGEPVDPETTVFKMASVSKPVAAMAVFSLINDGMWSLDEPLANYWVDPDIADDPRLKGITTRRVLSHTTGLPNHRGEEPLQFLYDPGERQSYSGEGYTYLKQAIEVKFGTSFQDIAEERVFSPAGMSHSSFRGPKTAGLHYTDKFHNDYMFDRPDWGAEDLKGGLMTTVPDLTHFLLWVLNNGAGLSEELWSEIEHSNSSELLQEESDMAQPFGLSWIVNREPERGIILSHGGSEFGARSYMVIIPKEKTGLVVVNNATGGMPAIRAIIEATIKAEKPLPTVERALEYSESFDR